MSRHGRWSSALMRLALLAAVLAVAGLASGCRSELTDTAHVRIGGNSLTVVVADSPAEQSHGLSGQRLPGEREGMLFVWEDFSPRAFTISSVDYDLDVIFIDEDDRVSEILPLSPDGPADAQGSFPARYVVEVRGGWAESHGVEPGDEFSIVEGAR